LNPHLAAAAVGGLKRRPFATQVIDGLDHSELSSAKLLGAAIALSRHLQQKFPDEKRIGIVLPASKGSVIANLAVALANKVPVGLNFTSGRAAVEAACKRADLGVMITAGAFIQRLADFPWTEQVLKLDEIMPPLKRSILWWWVFSIVAPTRLLLRVLRIPKQGGHAEAVLLFTSGSAGEPKGVILSHRNMLGNVAQFNVLLDATREDAILRLNRHPLVSPR
jgi:acyl-[acyl-carrier-protein]-phospholipid O-acyltransferase/long-chain-fatty-acid--[acyl-carrier-protein] ligase